MLSAKCSRENSVLDTLMNAESNQNLNSKIGPHIKVLYS